MPRTSKKTKKKASRKLKNTRIKNNKEIKIVNKVKGLKDILPADFKYWDLVSRKAGELAKLYSYQRFDIPLLEEVSLYNKFSGKSSDLVSKELFSFLDKANDKIALRPDVVPSLLRMIFEHNLVNSEEIFKSFWIGPVVRFDKTQGGRLRQFNQFSLNVFGSFGPAADAQLILIAYNFFKELQINIEVQINSLGCNECRQEYIQVIKDYFKERGRKARLSTEAKKILLKNPLQILGVKDEESQEIISNIPPIVDHLCVDCRQRFETVLEYLDNFSIPYNLNTNLVSVRDFDFFNNTIFDFTFVNENGHKVSLGSGGGYGEIAEKVSGQTLSACGFSVDLEKTISKIRGKDLFLSPDEAPDIFIAQISEQAKQKAMLLFEDIRKAGFKIRENLIQDSLKLQLEEAERLKVRFTLILGQKELLDNTIVIRDMESGVQETVDLRRLINELDKRLNIN